MTFANGIKIYLQEEVRNKNILNPPSRSVIILLKLLNVPHELKYVNLLKGEQNKPEYLKMNPQNKVPVLDDNGFIVLDSHAINSYLVNRYAEEDKLYPKDPKARSIVDHRMYFDCSVLFPATRTMVLNAIRNKAITTPSSTVLEKVEESHGILEQFLKNHQFIAGDETTIADISTCTTLDMMSFFLSPNEKKYPLLTAYLKRCEADIPHLASLNQSGIRAFEELIR